MPAMKVPRLGPDIEWALNRDFSDKRDEQIAKIQASVLANLHPSGKFLVPYRQAGFYR